MLRGLLKGCAVAGVVLLGAASALAKDGQIRISGVGGGDSVGTGSIRVTAKQGNKTYDVTIDYPHDGKTTGRDAAQEHGQKIKDAGFTDVTVTGSSIFIIGCDKVDGGRKKGTGRVKFGGDCPHQEVEPGQKFKFTCALGPGMQGGAHVSVATCAANLSVTPAPTYFSELSFDVLAGETTEVFMDRVQSAMTTAGWTVTRTAPDTVRIDSVGGGVFEVFGMLASTSDPDPESEREAHVTIWMPGAAE